MSTIEKILLTAVALIIVAIIGSYATDFSERMGEEADNATSAMDTLKNTK